MYNAINAAKLFKSSKHLSQNYKSTKKHPCKYQKTSSLKNTFKKDWKRACITE